MRNASLHHHAGLAPQAPQEGTDEARHLGPRETAATAAADTEAAAEEAAATSEAHRLMGTEEDQHNNADHPLRRPDAHHNLSLVPTDIT